MSVAFGSATRPLVARPAAARHNVRAHAKAGNWLPGADSPKHLDGSLPGDYGFDPLGLGEQKLDRLRESELIHGRWAMLGVVGALVPELLGFGDWFEAPLWAVNGGTPSYFGVPVPLGIKTILLVELVAMAGVELLRAQQSEPLKRAYPGGAFDPMGFGKDGSKLENMKLKEVKNGRLAMVAFIGFIGQHAATGQGPLAALGSHLADPANNNFATNGVSLPPSAFPFLYSGELF